MSGEPHLEMPLFWIISTPPFWFTGFGLAMAASCTYLRIKPPHWWNVNHPNIFLLRPEANSCIFLVSAPRAGAAAWWNSGRSLERRRAGGALGGRRSLNLLTPAADKSLDQKSDGWYHTRGPTHRLQPHETGPGGGGVYCTVQLYCGPVQHWAGHCTGEGGRGWEGGGGPPAHHHDPATGGGADTVQWAGPGAITWGPGAGAPHEQGPHEPV